MVYGTFLLILNDSKNSSVEYTCDWEYSHSWKTEEIG